MDFNQARETVLDFLRRQGRAKNSQLRLLIGDDETLLEQVREDLIFNDLAEDKKGVGLVYVGAAAQSETHPANVAAGESSDARSSSSAIVAASGTRRLRIFLSYGHDQNIPLARRVKADLEARGHEVWFDEERLQPGLAWEQYIEQGLAWTATAGDAGRVVLLMTPHAVRRPDGYCLNEVSRALAHRVPVVPVMVVWCEPPLSICRIQWLDMTDCVPPAEHQGPYERKSRRLIEALETDRIDFEGTQQRLLNLLQPLPFDSEIAQYLERFTGRQWVFAQIDAWLADPQASRVFWITGAPGVGKTAIAAWLCEHRREVAAFHLCRYGHVEKSDPRRCVLSLTYQLTTQLYEYQQRLARLPLEQTIPASDARTLFDRLIVQPLSQDFPRPDGAVVLLIDALDEATRGGRNELAWFLGTEFRRTPDWLRLIITSRPDAEVMLPLQGYAPYLLNASSPDNQEDIRVYLRRELPPCSGGEVAGEAIETILARSEGVFLYVAYVRREIAAARLSPDRPADFPCGLGEVYAQMLARQFPDAAAYQRDVAPALDVVAAAREPLELAMLGAMFGWDERRTQQFRRALGSLFTFTAADSRVLPFHKSVLDWLTDADKAGDYFVSIQSGHQRLAGWGWHAYERGVPQLCPYVANHLLSHLAAARRWDELETMLADLEFLETKSEAGQVFDLVADVAAANGALPADRPQRRVLRLLEEALRRDIHFIARHVRDYPQAFFQCLWNSCWWYDHAGVQSHYEQSAPSAPDTGPLFGQKDGTLHRLLEQFRRRKKAVRGQPPWLESLRPPPIPLGTAQYAVIRGHRHRVRSVAYSPDGQFFATGSHDHTAKVWDAATGEQLQCFDEHCDSVTSVAFSPDGRRLVSGSDDKTLRVWDLATQQEVCRFVGHKECVTCVVFSPDGLEIASGSWNSRGARVWNAYDGVERCLLRGQEESLYALAYSPAGDCLVTGGSDSAIRIWDVHSGRLLRTLQGHDNTVVGLAFSPDGRRLASASRDRTVRVWDVEQGRQLLCISGHAHLVESVAFSPDGRSVASSSADRTVRRWDAVTGQQLACFEGHQDRVVSVAYSPDGRHLLSGSFDQSVRIWDAGGGAAGRRLVGHTEGVTCLAFSLDGNRLASCGLDRTVRIWDANNGREAHCLRGHTSDVYKVAFSEDGRRVLSWSMDRTTRVWDIATGQCLEVLDANRELPVYVISPEDATRRALVQGPDTVIEDIDSGRIIAWFPAELRGIVYHAGRNLWAGAVRNQVYLLALRES